MTAKLINTIALLAAACGAFLLFRYGLPFKQRTGGQTYLVTGEIDECERVQERRADRLGWLGFSLGVAAVALQLVVVWL